MEGRERKKRRGRIEGMNLSGVRSLFFHWCQTSQLFISRFLNKTETMDIQGF